LGNPDYDRFTDENLIGQRNSLVDVISQESDKVSALEDDAKRLRDAESSIQKIIENMQETNSKVKDLEVDLTKWKGTEKGKFEKEKSTFRNGMKSYENATTGILVQIETKIMEIETDITRINSQITKFQTQLSNVRSELNARGV